MAKTNRNTIETLKLKPSDIAAAIHVISKTKISLFIWGPPGISKSATTKQVATGLNIAFIDVRLSQMDPTDLRGIPYPVPGEDGIRWSAPLILPRNLDLDRVVSIEAVETVVKFNNPRGSNKIFYVTDPRVSVEALDENHTAELIVRDDEIELKDRFRVILRDKDGKKVAGKVHFRVTGKAKGILALEEFNSAPPSVQAAAYQLVLDRALGEYEVPDDVIIVGMGNRDTDRGVTFKMPTPIMNRFVHLEMVVDFEDWQRWALMTGQHRDVVGYLTHFQDKLMMFDVGTAARGFATPRSWSFVSDILNSTEGDDIKEMVAIGLFTGAVGDAEGIQFMDFHKRTAELPAAEKILDGTLKQMPNRVEVSLAYALTTTLCYQLRERAENVKRSTTKETWMNSDLRKRWMFEADNFLEFMLTNFSQEICIMGAKTAINMYKLPFDTMRMKHFNTFAEEFKDLIMG